MRDQDLQPREGLGRALYPPPPPPPPPKNWALHLSFMPHPISILIADTYWKKLPLLPLRKN